MQYLLSVINDRPDLATSDEQAAIDVFNDQAPGRWLLGLRRRAGVAQHGHRRRQPG